MPKKQPKQKSKDQVTITYSEPFAATVKKGKDGKNTLVIKSPIFYRHQLNKFKPGTEVTLELHTRKSKRTDAQNRYYWGVYLPMIAAETGETNLDRLHELFRGEFLTEGVVEVLGKKVRLKKSTTALSVSEFSQYITDIESNTGIQAPPTENYGLSPLRESSADIEYPDDELGESVF